MPSWQAKKKKKHTQKFQISIRYALRISQSSFSVSVSLPCLSGQTVKTWKRQAMKKTNTYALEVPMIKKNSREQMLLLGYTTAFPSCQVSEQGTQCIHLA